MKHNADACTPEGVQKHTPSPWVVQTKTVVGEGTDTLKIYQGPWQTNTSKMRLICGKKVDGPLSVEDHANARLIAAAPDLLDALCLAEATIERLNRHNSADGTLHCVREAIRKATGDTERP